MLIERYQKRWPEINAHAAESALATLQKLWQDGDVSPDDPGACEPDNASRLAYYRSHGLADCHDYPGGDAQFERDVLSGEYHDAVITTGGPKREDAYIIARMRDGRFAYTPEFEKYAVHPELMLAFFDLSRQNGFVLSPGLGVGYPGGPAQLRKDILSGEFAERRAGR